MENYSKKGQNCMMMHVMARTVVHFRLFSPRGTTTPASKTHHRISSIYYAFCAHHSHTHHWTTIIYTEILHTPEHLFLFFFSFTTGLLISLFTYQSRISAISHILVICIRSDQFLGDFERETRAIKRVIAS